MWPIAIFQNILEQHTEHAQILEQALSIIILSIAQNHSTDRTICSVCTVILGCIVFSITIHKLLHWQRGWDPSKMPTYGKIGEYDPDLEDWLQYMEGLENFLVANNNMSAEKKRATFLAVIGPSAY